jgi:hypothetical protein
LRNPDLIQRKISVRAQLPKRINVQCDIDNRMKPVIDSLIAAVLIGLGLLCIEAAIAAPMRCSGEQKTCTAICNKSLDRGSISTCVTNCGLRQSLCMKTGCWDSGVQKYCGLLKQ